jgi:hypothetical protein
MNERIKQLAEQVVGPSRLHGGDFALMGNEQVEKFAKLIIEECVDYAFANGDNVDYLKQYFGVEL